MKSTLSKTISICNNKMKTDFVAVLLHFFLFIYAALYLILLLLLSYAEIKYFTATCTFTHKPNTIQFKREVSPFYRNVIAATSTQVSYTYLSYLTVYFVDIKLYNKIYSTNCMNNLYINSFIRFLSSGSYQDS